jgi:hypothetical protein
MLSGSYPLLLQVALESGNCGQTLSSDHAGNEGSKPVKYPMLVLVGGHRKCFNERKIQPFS